METKLKQEPVADGNGRIVCKHCLKSNGEHNTEDECIDNRGHLLGTEWEPLTPEPVADGGGLPLDITKEDEEQAKVVPSEIARPFVARLVACERQLASSQEALRAAREIIEEYRGLHMSSRRPCVESATCSTCQEADALFEPKAKPTQQGDKE